MKLEAIIAQNLRGFRLKLEWTQEAIAGRAGLHSNFYARCERGEATLSIETLAKLAKTLRIEPYLLLKEGAYKD